MLLYVSQEANFQSRTMLVPMDDFLKVRQADYDLLKKHAQPQTFKIDKKDYTVDNVLYVHWTREGNTGSQVPNLYLKIVNELTSYADGNDIYDWETEQFHNCYFDMKDQSWYDAAKIRLCGGFNHPENHQYLLQKYPNIVDSFLVLDIED